MPKAKPPLVIGPERGVWFRAKVQAHAKLESWGVDHRWGRNMHWVQVPPTWVLYLSRNGKVRVGNTKQLAPAPRFFPDWAYPDGVQDLGSADRTKGKQP